MTHSFGPLNTQKILLRKRRKLDGGLPNRSSIHYSGRSGHAIESNNLIDDSNIIWTSGIDTWKSLAKKGYWVNGTSDSLGENNSPEESIFKEVSWLKVSHKDNLN